MLCETALKQTTLTQCQLMILSFRWRRRGAKRGRVAALLKHKRFCDPWPSALLKEARICCDAVRKTATAGWRVCATSCCRARACWLPCLGDMQGTYVVLEPLGWHWRWGKTVLQGKCFPRSQPATAYTAQLIDESPVDFRTLRFTHKRKGQLTKCYQLRFPWLNTRLHMPPHKTGSFHHISLEEIHNHMLYMHLRLRL